MSCATEGFSAITKVFAIETVTPSNPPHPGCIVRPLPEPYPELYEYSRTERRAATISPDLTPAGRPPDLEKKRLMPPGERSMRANQQSGTPRQLCHVIRLIYA